MILKRTLSIMLAAASYIGAAAENPLIRVPFSGEKVEYEEGEEH